MQGFITFEGIEGSGKTTQIGLLHRALVKQGWDVLLTREPGGTPTGDRIRALLLDSTSVMAATTELLLYAAARAEHVETLIRPALAAGRTVLCDRFTDATYAYQGYGRGLPLDLIEAIHALKPLAITPDRTVLFDLEPGEAIGRARRRESAKTVDESRFEREGAAFHERVRRGYLEIARKAPGRFLVVDGSGGPEAVHRRVLEALCVS